MKEDLKILEAQELTNICLVKKLDKNNNPVESHILFNNWVGTTVETFKIEKTPKGLYKLYRKGILIKKDLKVENVGRYTSRLKPLSTIDPLRTTQIQDEVMEGIIDVGVDD